MDTTAEVRQDGVPADDDQEITPWEKTDEALDAAAELMPVCEIADDDAIGEDGQPLEERQTVEAIVDGPDGSGAA